jgi:hypothetical protein
MQRSDPQYLADIDIRILFGWLWHGQRCLSSEMHRAIRTDELDSQGKSATSFPRVKLELEGEEYDWMRRGELGDVDATKQAQHAELAITGNNRVVAYDTEVQFGHETETSVRTGFKALGARP